MPQDDSIFQYPFWGVNVPLQCVLEEGHYSDPDSYHHAFFPNENYIVVWDDNGDRVEWDDAVAGIGDASEISIDPLKIPEMAAVWSTVPQFGDLDNMEEVAILTDAMLGVVGLHDDRIEELEPDTSWSYVGAGGEYPAFQNSYVNIPSASKTAYRKVTADEVKMVINVRNGTANAVIFTLPEGYRPSAPQAVLGLTTTDFSSFTTCLVQIATNGAVKVLFPTSLTNILIPAARFSIDSPEIAS